MSIDTRDAFSKTELLDEIDRLRASTRNDVAVIASTLRRAEQAEAALARVRELCSHVAQGGWLGSLRQHLDHPGRHPFGCRVIGLEVWTTEEIEAMFKLSNLPTVKVYPMGPGDVEPYHTTGTLLYQLRLRRRKVLDAIGCTCRLGMSG